MTNYDHLHMNLNNGFLDISIGESDQYTELTHIKIEKRVFPEEIESKFELFFQTPLQLRQLAKFFHAAADKVQREQTERVTHERIDRNDANTNGSQFE